MATFQRIPLELVVNQKGIVKIKKVAKHLGWKDIKVQSKQKENQEAVKFVIYHLLDMIAEADI